MLAPRHVHNNKSLFIGSKRDPFLPTVPPSRKADDFRVLNILNFSALEAIHWRQPACSPRLFPTTPTPNPTVGDEVVAAWMGVGVSCQCRFSLWSRAMLHDKWPMLLRRDQCVAVIGDDSPLVGREADALNSNPGCSRGLGMELSEEMESAPARFGSSGIRAFSSSVRVHVGAGGECP